MGGESIREGPEETDDNGRWNRIVFDPEGIVEGIIFALEVRCFGWVGDEVG